MQASRTNLTAGSVIPVSSESRSKLGAFTFSKPSTPSKTAGRRKGVSGGNYDDTDVFHDPLSDSIPVPDPIKECPKTPAPRLPLSDLIGIGDDGRFTPTVPQVEASPEDRIMWQLSPRGTPHGGSQTTPAPNKTKRGKKRPPSSPPMSSPNFDSPAGKQHHKEASNLQRTGFIPKTPLADPAMQLWSKYSTAGTTNARVANPATRLFGTEGIQRAGVNQSPLGLRRAYSCGPDWPHSRLKRRKTNSSEEICELDESMEAPLDKDEDFGNHGPGPSRLSRVSRLVDKVKETLEKPSSMPNVPSSSSPLPYTHDHHPDITSSPTRRVAKRHEVNAENMESGECANGNAQTGSSDTEDFGDFDDDDIDMVMLEKAEELASETSQIVYQNNTFAEPIPMAKLPLVEEQPKLPSTVEFDDDEFDDDDDTFYTADVENLISKYETQTAQPISDTHSANPSQKYLQELILQESTNAIAASQVMDEFGDIDFDEWNEEELKLSSGLVCIPSTEICRTSNDFKKDLKPKSIKRYLVIGISKGDWKWQNNATREEKV